MYPARHLLPCDPLVWHLHCDPQHDTHPGATTRTLALKSTTMTLISMTLILHNDIGYHDTYPKRHQHATSMALTNRTLTLFFCSTTNRIKSTSRMTLVIILGILSHQSIKLKLIPKHCSIDNPLY